MGVVEDLDEIGKLGREFSSMDDLDKVDIGDGVISQPTYVSARLILGQKDEYPMPVADLMIDSALGNKVISFLDGNA
jgi:hypothetical protein